MSFIVFNPFVRQSKGTLSWVVFRNEWNKDCVFVCCTLLGVSSEINLFALLYKRDSTSNVIL